MKDFPQTDPPDLRMIREGQSKEDSKTLNKRATLQRAGPHSDLRAPN